MSQISKYPISKNVSDRIFNIFIKSLVKANSKTAQKLVNDLFSSTERIMLAKRLAIAFLLMKNYEYREISKLLRVSLGTIASVNRSLSLGNSGYQIILESINKEEGLDKFFLDTADKLLSIPAKSGMGSGSWRYLPDQVRKIKFKKAQEF